MYQRHRTFTWTAWTKWLSLIYAGQPPSPDLGVPGTIIPDLPVSGDQRNYLRPLSPVLLSSPVAQPCPSLLPLSCCSLPAVFVARASGRIFQPSRHYCPLLPLTKTRTNPPCPIRRFVATQFPRLQQLLVILKMREAEAS